MKIIMSAMCYASTACKNNASASAALGTPHANSLTQKMKYSRIFGFVPGTDGKKPLSHGLGGCLLLALLVISPIAQAQTTIGFEGLTDGTVVSTQYSGLGVTFSGGPQVETSGVSLNQFDFPPHSGSNVLANIDVNSGASTGPISGTFSSTMESIGGYFTYVDPVTLEVFDSKGNLVDSATSLTSANYTSAPGTPNEFISISLPTGFSSFEIIGNPNPNGGTFTLDDFTFSPSIASVPDSMGFLPVAAVLACIVGFDYLTRKRQAGVRA